MINPDRMKELSAAMVGDNRAVWQARLGRWLTTAGELERRLEEEAGIPNVNIDEIAVTFSSQERLLEWVQSAVGSHPEFTLFNVAHDNVHTGPIDSGYRVMYNFLGTGTPLRVEAMYIEDGFSPLHEAMMSPRIEGVETIQEVHYSFKCHSNEEYMETCEALEAVWQLAMWCESSYGQFSYFVPLGDRGPYVKPRFNSRDMPIMKGASDL